MDPSRDDRLHRLTRALEWPMVILALLLIPTLLVDVLTTDPALRNLATAVNWVIWLGFAVELVLRMALAPARRAFLRANWFDVVIVLFSVPIGVPESWQGLRTLRIVRLFRFLRIITLAGLGLRKLRGALQHRQFHLVGAAAVLIVVVGAAAERYFESRDGAV